MFVAIFLYYKYITKIEKQQKEKESKKINAEKFVPTMNPSVPIDYQIPYVNYLENTIPINNNEQITTYDDMNPPNIYPEYLNDIYNTRTNPLYNLNPSNVDKDHNNYTGTFNTYKNALNEPYPNPFEPGFERH